MGQIWFCCIGVKTFFFFEVKFHFFSQQPSSAELKLTKDIFMYRAYLAGVSVTKVVIIFVA